MQPPQAARRGRGVGGLCHATPFSRACAGERGAEPWVSAPWGCWGALGHQQHCSRHRVPPSASRLCWLLSCRSRSSALRLLRGGTREGQGDGAQGWREMSQRGEEGLPSLPPAPPTLRDVGSGASLPAPHPGVSERCHKCHNAVRSQPAPAHRRLFPRPRLSSAWFSLACFLCHTVQSLGFGGGLCFINPISLVIQITLPFLLKVAGVRAGLAQSLSLNSNQIGPTGWQKLRGGRRDG